MRFRHLLLPLLLVAASPLAAQTTGPAVATEPYAWRNATIVAGGFITGIFFSPLEKDLAYVRTDIGGAYRFDAPTKKWIPLTDWVGPRNSNLSGCESIALDPKDPDIVYLALGTYSRGPAAIARSTDRGKTFQTYPTRFTMGGNEDGRGMGERLLVAPATPTTLYFASRHDGLWTSTDSAATWSRLQGPPASLSFIIADPHSADLYVGVAEPDASNHLLRSTDHGKTWQPLPPLLAPHNTYLPHRAAILNNDLYVTLSNGPGPNDVTAGAVYRFDIDHQTWNNITPPPPLNRGNAGFAAVALDPQHPGTLLVSTLDRWNPGDEIFRSTDFGKTWKPVSRSASRDPALSPYLHWGQQQPRFGWWLAAVALDPFDPNHALYGTGATIWGTRNLTALDEDKPTSWSVAADGIEETAVLALVSPPAGPPLISGLGDIGGFTHDDLTTSPKSGMHENPRFTNTNLLDIAWRKPTIIVRSGIPGGAGAARPNGPMAALSQDAGHTWRPLTLPQEATHIGGGFFGASPFLVLSSDGTSLLTTTQSGFAASRDSGTTWTPVQGLPPNVHPIADRAAQQTFYAIDLPTQKLYTSADAGLTFTAQEISSLPVTPNQLNGPGRNSNAWHFSLQSSFLHPGHLFLLFRNTLYHSTDAGLSWHPLTDSAVTINSFSLGAPAPNTTTNTPTVFIAGTINNLPALYRSTDLAKTFTRINDDTHQYGAFPTVITADPRIFGRLYLGTNGRGILYGDPAQ